MENLIRNHFERTYLVCFSFCISFILFVAILSQTFTNKISEFDNNLLVKDHHHLKTKIWLERFGLGKYEELQRYLKVALNYRTKAEFEEYRSDLYEALADRPKDVD